MALFGRKTAVIPLGVSCQTAFQVERALPLIAELADDVMVQETTPFDWRIVGAADLANMIADANPYPASADELDGNTKRPYWAKRRCHFWHDGASDFAAFTSKQAHLWANWSKIGSFDRKVFVISNTQNNLAQTLQAVGGKRGFEYLLHPVDIAMLAHQLKRQFSRPELHVVTRKDLVVDPDSFGRHLSVVKGVRVGVHFVKTDLSQWSGDAKIWDVAFRSILDPARVAA